jgi:integrase
MASIHRDARNRSPFWYAAYTLPDGTRCSKSTKLTDRSKALKLAIEWEHLSRGVAERDPTGAQIARVNLDIYERATGQRVEVVFVGDFLRSWYERASNLKSKRTGMRYKQVVEDFLSHIGPARVKSNIGSVRENDIQSFLDKEAKDGKSATTVAIAAKVLRIPFNLALKQGLILRQPVSSLDIPDGNAQQKKAFAWPQVLKLISVAEGDWITAVMLGAYCGMRLGDCVNLKWENVNFDEDVIRFVPEKTSRGKRRKELTVPIHPALKLHLDALKKKAVEGQFQLCPTLQGKSVGGRSGLSKSFIEDVMAKAGISNQSKATKASGKGRAFSSLSFHSLRHSFNSELANKGVSQELRRHLTGHASDKMNDLYSHLDKDLLKTAVNKLPAKKT